MEPRAPTSTELRQVYSGSDSLTQRFKLPARPGPRSTSRQGPGLRGRSRLKRTNSAAVGGMDHDVPRPLGQAVRVCHHIAHHQCRGTTQTETRLCDSS